MSIPMASEAGGDDRKPHEDHRIQWGRSSFPSKESKAFLGSVPKIPRSHTEHRATSVLVPDYLTHNFLCVLQIDLISSRLPRLTFIMRAKVASSLMTITVQLLFQTES